MFGWGKLHKKKHAGTKEKLFCPGMFKKEKFKTD